jgi:apolipoprotein D and lipocalin family protein
VPFQLRNTAVPAALLLSFLLVAPRVRAQAATAVPSLDLNRTMGTWYEIARYPIKRQKHCIGGGMVLYALGDKRKSFQVVTTCQLKDNNADSWNNKGKMDAAGDGALKLSGLWPFTTKYWILAIAPDYSWALVGNPNHKSLWVLAKSPTLSPSLFSEIEAKAAAQGFNTSRLIKITQPH